MENSPKPRERSVAHLWCDKRIVRFLRKNFEKRMYRKLRDVYLALCEIDSDFVEERESETKSIHSLVKTCSTYTGMDQEVVNKAMVILRTLGMINYGKKQNDKGQVIGSFLFMPEWMGKEYYEKNHTRLKPLMDETTCIKNSILGDVKNSSKEEGNTLSSSKEEEQLCGAAASNDNLTETSWRKGKKAQPETHPSEKNVSQSFKRKNISPSIYKNDTDPYEIINYWNNTGLMYIDPQRSKAAASQLSALMRGEFFENYPLSNGHSQFIGRPFSKNDILSAIENRARASIDPTYSPIDPAKKSKMRKLPFYLWLYNAKTAESQFLKDFEKPPKSARRKVDLVPDEQPDHTEAVKEAYVKSVLHGIEPITPWSAQDENDFRNAGALLWEFFERTSSVIPSYYRNDPEKKAKYLINAIRSSMKDDEKSFPIRWLCSDNTFMKYLPAFLGEQRIIQSNSY